MARYRLLFKKAVAKDLRAVPKEDAKRILKQIEALSDEPRPVGCEKLTDQERYRVRQGSYRSIYKIEDDVLVVTIVKIAHRSISVVSVSWRRKLVRTISQAILGAYCALGDI